MNSMACEDRITSGERQAGRSHAGKKAPVGFARFAAQLARMGDDELLAVFSEGDGYASSVLVDDVELAYECANGATFEGSVFRDCLFEQVDFGDCTFRDVRFEQCRFIGCTMDKGWLNRVDLRDCSAPGLSLLQARLSQVSAAACDLSFANISETSIDHMALRDCRMREAAFQRAKLRHVSLADCDLTRIDVFGTSLAGIDVSTCLFQAPVLSGDYRELRGLVVSPEQALSLATLLGVRIAEE